MASRDDTPDPFRQASSLRRGTFDNVRSMFRASMSAEVSLNHALEAASWKLMLQHPHVSSCIIQYTLVVIMISRVSHTGVVQDGGIASTRLDAA